MGRHLIGPIQYLRGIAALMVVWHHSREQLPGLHSLFTKDFGIPGVELFFVISGFIMVVTTAGRRSAPADFMRRRLIRIYPLYALLTLMLVAACLIKPDFFRTVQLTASHVIESLLFIPHYAPRPSGKIWPVLNPGWTLDLEIFFYLIFAPSLRLGAKAQLAAVSAFITSAVLLGHFFGPFTDPRLAAYTQPILLGFVAGMGIANVYVRRPSVFAVAPGYSWLLIGLGVLASFYVPILGPSFVIVACLNPRCFRGGNAALLTLGNASYSIYLSHLFTLGVLRQGWVGFLGPSLDVPRAYSFMFLSLLTASGVGCFVYRAAESPLRGLFKESG